MTQPNVDFRSEQRVCRDLLRPPFALGAVQHTTDGQVRVRFKKPSRNGATYAQTSPERFLARLCALVPPPAAHTVPYYGVLAPRHALPARIVPTPETTNIEPKQLSLFVGLSPRDSSSSRPSPARPSTSSCSMSPRIGSPG